MIFHRQALTGQGLLRQCKHASERGYGVCLRLHPSKAQEHHISRERYQPFLYKPRYWEIIELKGEIMELQYKIISRFYDLLDVFYFYNRYSNPRKCLLEYIPNEKLNY